MMEEYTNEVIIGVIGLLGTIFAGFFSIFPKRKPKIEYNLEQDQWLMEKNKQIFEMLENRLKDAENEIGRLNADILSIREAFNRYRKNAEENEKRDKERIRLLEEKLSKYK